MASLSCSATRAQQTEMFVPVRLAQLRWQDRLLVHLVALYGLLHVLYRAALACLSAGVAGKMQLVWRELSAPLSSTSLLAPGKRVALEKRLTESTNTTLAQIPHSSGR